jgi:hypothetical protein
MHSFAKSYLFKPALLAAALALGACSTNPGSGGYGATVGETGPEEPDVLIVPGARIYDLVPVRELPYGLAALIIAASEAGQMAASDQVSNQPKNRLRSGGRPQMESRR